MCSIVELLNVVDSNVNIRCGFDLGYGISANFHINADDSREVQISTLADLFGEWDVEVLGIDVIDYDLHIKCKSNK